MSATAGGGQSWLVGKSDRGPTTESDGAQGPPLLVPLPWQTFGPVQEPAPAPGQSASVLHGPVLFVPALHVWLHTGQTWMPGAAGVEAAGGEVHQVGAAAARQRAAVAGPDGGREVQAARLRAEAAAAGQGRGRRRRSRRGGGRRGGGRGGGRRGGGRGGGRRGGGRGGGRRRGGRRGGRRRGGRGGRRLGGGRGGGRRGA